MRIYRRTHRRAIVIDGKVAFTGGAAISKKWVGDVRTAHEWRDSMMRITGPLVGGIQSAFTENWVYCTGEVLRGERFFPPSDARGRALQRLGGELAVRRPAVDPHPLLAHHGQRPAPALDLQLRTSSPTRACGRP